MRVVYDTEIYKNLLLYVFYELDTGEYKVFAISPYHDDRVELMKYLKQCTLMIGFNVLRFDYPLLHYLIDLLRRNFTMKGQKLVELMFNKASDLIKNNKFAEVRNPIIPQCDLYRIHHFDNVAKATSLKMLEFVFRMPNIEELPYPPDTVLTAEQIDKVIAYCKNDVFATTTTYEKSQQEILLRERLSSLYNLPMENWNDPKIGEQILMKFVYDKLECSDLGKSPRDKIVFKDIIFPYIQFEQPQFQAIHQWFMNKTITETKKVFSELPMEEIESLKPYINLDKKNIVKGKVKTLNIVYNGFRYDFGTGGIHGSIESGVYQEDDEWTIIDIDVESYYPNLGIKNKLYPEHLTDIFCQVYEGIFHERKKYAKKTPENLGLKLALNGSYGKSNSPFSPLYDPRYTMSITINGQLLLCMLAEWLSVIPDIIMLQINTDGLTIKVKRSYEGLVNLFCQRWEQLTKLTLERAVYSKMVIRDVNNYIAVSTNGTVKRKGTFGYKPVPGEKELHKNHSMLIIPKALEKYYVEGIPIEKSIMEGDLWDFFKRVKLNGAARLVGRANDQETKYGKITRYYVSEHGETLIKILPPLKKVTEREFNIEAGYICTVANVVNDQVLTVMRQNINYQYYISECEKIINAIHLHQELNNEED